MRAHGWLILLLVVVYLGLVTVAVRGAPSGSRLRVGATWLFSGAAVTILVARLEEMGASNAAIFLAGVGAVALVTLLGVGLRRSGGTWPYVMAGVLGGVMPVALLIAFLGWYFAAGHCFG
jgi:hypothetical protein